jgi:hypothetical protein
LNAPANLRPGFDAGQLHRAAESNEADSATLVGLFQR